MKDIFKKIVRPLDLREYAPEMGTEILVWVNPPRSLLLENTGMIEAVRAIRVELQALAEQAAVGGQDEAPQTEAAVLERGKELAERLEEIGRAQMELTAKLWSQGPDPETHWSVEEIGHLVEQAADTDPALWAWLRSRTMQMIAEYRAGQKKA